MSAGGTAKNRISKYFHLNEFRLALERLGVDCKLVKQTDYITGFPSKDIQGWFSKKKFHNLIDEYKPDIVFCDTQQHFALETIKLGIPCFTYLRGNRWMEIEWAKKTIYRDPIMKTVLNMRHKNSEKVFRTCQGIFMTADYLDAIIKEHIPNATTFHFLEGLDTSRWYPEEGMTLEHPCVGMCHDANWWGKTKEMLTLENVVKELEHVHFYWAGDGQYKNPILEALEKYDNFHYLGSLGYPDKVRQYLTEIDMYALPTGMDTTPLSCREAMSMKKPIIATRVGGIPEMIYDNETGFLVSEGDYESWIKCIKLILDDNQLAKRLGEKARKLVQEKFNWDKLAKEFIKTVTPYAKKQKMQN